MNETLLTKADAENLARERSISAKSNVAIKISDYYNRQSISPAAQNIVEDIFRIMVQDIEKKVREVLSQSLKDSRSLPYDIVHSLVRDVDSISLPFIQNYSHFTQEDIIAILTTKNVSKHIAVALRKNLNYEISNYIIENCSPAVISVLVSNNDAQILDTTFNRILEKYPNHEKIKNNIVERTELPIIILEKLVSYLSDELLQKLINLHNLPNNVASDAVEQLKEKATLKISEEFSSDKQIEDLAKELHQNNRLSPSLIVRSICMGDLKFFEYALSLLSNTPIVEVRKTLSNLKADFMIRNLLRKSYIPKTLFPAIFSALEVIKEIKFDCCKENKNKFSSQVIERILSYNLSNEDLKPEDVQYLIYRIIG